RFGTDIGGDENVPPAFATIGFHAFYGAIHFGSDAPCNDAEVTDPCLAEPSGEIGRVEHLFAVNQSRGVVEIARGMSEAFGHLGCTPVIFVVEVADHAIVESCAGGDNGIDPFAPAMSH